MNEKITKLKSYLIGYFGSEDTDNGIIINLCHNFTIKKENFENMDINGFKYMLIRELEKSKNLFNEKIDQDIKNIKQYSSGPEGKGFIHR